MIDEVQESISVIYNQCLYLRFHGIEVIPYKNTVNNIIDS